MAYFVFYSIFYSSLWEVLKVGCELLSQVITKMCCLELWDTATYARYRKKLKVIYVDSLELNPKQIC